MKPPRFAQANVLIAAMLVGILALAVQYLLVPASLPARGEYFLTNLAQRQLGPISIGLAVASAFAFGFRSKASPALIGWFLAAIFPLISMYEATRYTGSHNLIPFELAIQLAATTPLMLAAWLGRMAARRQAPRDHWEKRMGNPDGE